MSKKLIEKYFELEKKHKEIMDDAKERSKKIMDDAKAKTKKIDDDMGSIKEQLNKKIADKAIEFSKGGITQDELNEFIKDNSLVKEKKEESKE